MDVIAQGADPEPGVDRKHPNLLYARPGGGEEALIGRFGARPVWACSPTPRSTWPTRRRSAVEGLERHREPGTEGDLCGKALRNFMIHHCSCIRPPTECEAKV